MKHQHLTTLHRQLAAVVLCACTVLVTSVSQAENERAQREYANSQIDAAGKAAELRLVTGLGHREAFRIKTDSGNTVIEADSPAGFIYGAQAVARGEATPGVVERPDFDIRGTTLPMFKDGGYKATLSPRIFPWFYDKELMTRTLDTFADARLNTIFLWGSHTFPYIVEMPKYPEASADVPPEQVKANQEQFRWFTAECEKRNIQVLLHFYNIHVSPPFARAHKIRTNPTTPTPLLKEYTHYALSRYFEEFPSVGLYACPGESIHSQHQLEWFRDVIFKAAKDSGKKPDIVIRDWTLNHDFRDQLKSLYDNVYSELKQNDESLTSPYPDIRHMKWEGLTAGHIINAAHGPAEDLVPMRWANPLFVREMTERWKALGFVRGVEFWGQSFWAWPYTYDRTEPRLLYLERDAPFYAVVGRYLWNADRNAEQEKAFWVRYYSRRFGSPEVGELVARWYEVSGSIGPGLLNLNATRVANWWSAVVLMEQNVDQILEYNQSLDQTPYTLHREAGRASQRFYPRPFDAYVFQRYQQKYGVPVAGKNARMFEEFYPYAKRMKVEDLAQRKCMPVSQYAEHLVKGEAVESALTPDKVVRLLHDLACESLALAKKAEKAVGHSPHQAELHRFVQDSQIFKLATEALMAKEDAAILKACILLKGEASDEEAEAFLKDMNDSVRIYEKLHQLGQSCYTQASFRTNWSHGHSQFRADLAKQRAWLAGFNKQAPYLPPGSIRLEAETMAGPWRKGNDRYTGFSGTGYAASYYAAVAAEPDPMTASVRIPVDGEYSVWVRALVGGGHQDRALAVEVASRRFEATHAGEGPPGGAFTWERAGSIRLPAGAVELKVHPVGKRHPVADVVILSPNADWQPEGHLEQR